LVGPQSGNPSLAPRRRSGLCLQLADFGPRRRQFTPGFLERLLLSLEHAGRVRLPRLSLAVLALGFLRTAAQAVALSFDLADSCLHRRQVAPGFLVRLLLGLKLASRIGRLRLNLVAFSLGFLRTHAPAGAVPFGLADLRLRRRHLPAERRHAAPGFLVRLLFSLEQTGRIAYLRLSLVAFSLGFLRALAPAGAVSFDRLLFRSEPPPGCIQSIVISFQPIKVGLQAAGTVDLNVQCDGENSRDDGSSDADQNLRRPGQ
jgi:hypothetical protein